MSVQPAVDRRQRASPPVVVGVDGSDASYAAVRWAAETAARRHRRLRIVHGMDLAATEDLFGVYDLLVPPVTDSLRRKGVGLVSAARRHAIATAAELTVETAVSPAHPARLLITESEAAHLVVLGAGAGGGLTHLGSTLLAVAAHGHGGVVVVRGEEPRARRTGPVVVGLDDSSFSAVAVAAAFAEASLRNAPVVAVHASSDITRNTFSGLPGILTMRELEAVAQDVLAEQLAGWSEKFPDVEVIRKVYPGGPRDQLLAWSKTAQLVVVGSRGRGGFRGILLGSTSNFLIQHAHCPVLVAHQH
jgi:nucleotide-binding universal stress UspA family protein